ncbi:hypothetical protein TNCV_2681401 [Trichonephila clavipes]|uniref:Uncharacterized protein n=1 Tax=Trichonephila clavipes TaxID=2585209 RepID=A0A8X6V676_TRICX|nr:hypothetical protein TNCV_2681401 [Trichonephila clavipes]
MKLRSSIQNHAFPHKHSRTNPAISFPDVSGLKQCPYLSPYRLALRIVAQIEMTLATDWDSVDDMPIYVLYITVSGAADELLSMVSRV